MSKHKINIGKIIAFTGISFVIYLVLESILFFQSEVCICNFSHYPTAISRIIGLLLFVISVVLFLVSLMLKGKFSKSGIILALIILGTAFYGNGFIINGQMGGCGYWLGKTTCFVVPTKFGDFAGEMGLNVDSLKTEKYKDNLLGYSISGKNLTLYRIGNKPLKVKIGFLFWKIRPNTIIHRLSPELHSYRNLEYEKNNEGYEFIGGQDMPMEVFINEFIIDHSEFASKKLKNQKIMNEVDGTTRFRFEIE